MQAGESIFCRVKSVESREEEETLIVCGRTQKLRTGKEAKVAGNLLHISGYQGENINTPSVECIVLF